jgi:hypothetical protein
MSAEPNEAHREVRTCQRAINMVTNNQTEEIVKKAVEDVIKKAINPIGKELKRLQDIIKVQGKVIEALNNEIKALQEGQEWLGNTVTDQVKGLKAELVTTIETQTSDNQLYTSVARALAPGQSIEFTSTTQSATTVSQTNAIYCTIDTLRVEESDLHAVQIGPIRSTI